jgi:TPR repeat protein
MAKSRSRVRQQQQSDLDRLFQRADKQQEAGELTSAFRLFLACAKAGDAGCQNNLGNFYRDGIGVKANRERALYWYRRAYRQGLRGAASNIGVLFRDENKLREALAWFERDGGGDANLAIAMIYLREHNAEKAIRYLKRVCSAKPDEMSEASRKEAESLLKRLLKPADASKVPRR